MGPNRSLNVLCVVTWMFLATSVHSAKQYVYFSEPANCGQTYPVARDAVIQIEEKRSSETGDAVFGGCSLLFRAGNLGDTLCMKITTLTFTSNKLQFQYFKSLDPSVGTPDLAYDSTNRATPPLEICDNTYEISMRLQALDASAKLNEVDILIEVYNMQGNQRIAYMDRDCGLMYNLRDSTISVLNTEPNAQNPQQSACQLYFEYVGTESNKICINFQKTKTTCGYELRVRDGPVSGSTLAHTYTCNNTSPQQWCAEKSAMQLELVVSGNTPLPVDVFAVEVKDVQATAPTTPPATQPENSSGAPTIMLLTLVASVVLALCV